MKKIRPIILAVVVPLTVSCGDFLDQYTGALTYVNTIEDVEELLLGEGYMKTEGIPYRSSSDFNASEPMGSWLLYFEDNLFRDYDEAPLGGGGTVTNLVWHSFYKFSQDPFVEVENPNDPTASRRIKDATWKGLYAKNSVLNSVIEELENFTDRPQYTRIKGEAHFLRAYNYFMLVNIYAKHYGPRAATDPGVPIKTTAEIEDKNYERDPVAEVYSLISSDLEAALGLLEHDGLSSIYRAGYYPACALMGRVCLYMQQWEDACKYLGIVYNSDKYMLEDYNLTDFGTTGSALVINSGSSEIIFSEGPTVIFSPNPQYEEDFTDARFPEHDKRRRWFGSSSNQSSNVYFTGVPGKKVCMSPGSYLNWNKISNLIMIRYAETVLSLAEAEFMAGDQDRAAEILEEFRYHRYEYAYDTSVPERGKDLIDLIREEREKELCFECGHNWFDNKRYALNTDYPYSKAFRHTVADVHPVTKEVTRNIYELPPYTDDNPGNWLIPIPKEEIELSRGSMVQNQRYLIQPQSN